MGEWLSNNILLPIMYIIIDVGLFLGAVLLTIILTEKIKELING